MRPNLHIWLPPTTVEEADERIVNTRRNVRDIQRQLSNSNRLSSMGERLTPQQYHNWRARALLANAHALEELDRLKCWRAAHVEEQKNCGDLLCRVYWDLIDMQRAGFELPPEFDETLSEVHRRLFEKTSKLPGYQGK
jgi:hypothetical protein